MGEQGKHLSLTYTTTWQTVGGVEISSSALTRRIYLPVFWTIGSTLVCYPGEVHLSLMQQEELSPEDSLPTEVSIKGQSQPSQASKGQGWLSIAWFQ